MIRLARRGITGQVSPDSREMQPEGLRASPAEADWGARLDLPGLWGDKIRGAAGYR
jgi:hypothetical protein